MVELLLAVMAVAAEPGPFQMSTRSKLVQAGRITSANFASPSNQIDWLTTNSRFSDWYIRTWRLELLMVAKIEPPYL